MKKNKNFKLEFTQYEVENEVTYNLTVAENLVYCYMKTIIEFDSKSNYKNKNWVFFQKSKQIAENTNLTEWTINNIISKLVKKELIEIEIKKSFYWAGNIRFVYLFWEKINVDLVDDLFKNMYLSNFVEDTNKIRAIIWMLIYKKWKKVDEIVEEMEELFDYDSWELISEGELIEFYRGIN